MKTPLNRREFLRNSVLATTGLAVGMELAAGSTAGGRSTRRRRRDEGSVADRQDRRPENHPAHPRR